MAHPLPLQPFKQIYAENTGDNMNKNFLPPLLVLTGMLGIIAVMAGTSFFDPIVRYVHSDNLTGTGAILCLLFTAGGFFACYSCLNILCTYFVPRIKAPDLSESADKHA